LDEVKVVLEAACRKFGDIDLFADFLGLQGFVQ
jgi:hypothetical protein